MLALSITRRPNIILGEPGSNRSDIFALGVIAYEMLTGRLPYTKGFSSARDVQRYRYIDARTLRDDIPVWVDAALAKAVEKRPSERTDALSAFVEDLNRPNTALGYNRPRPIIERNPLVFWQTLSALLAVVVVVLAFLAARN